MALSICCKVPSFLVLTMSKYEYHLLHILLEIHLPQFLAKLLQIVLLKLLRVTYLHHFFFPAILSASIPILNPGSNSFPGFIPNIKNSSLDSPSLGQKSLKYFSTSATGNISFPAGTGVCVVKTVFELAISFATSNDTCFFFLLYFWLFLSLKMLNVLHSYGILLVLISSIL